MPLRITTPNTSLDEGRARLSSFSMGGGKSQRIFTLELDDSEVGPTGPFHITLVEQGGTGGFFLFPSVNAEGSTVSVILNPGARASFAVGYDSSLGDATGASVYCSVNISTGSTYSTVLIGPTSSIGVTLENPTTETRRELGTLLSVNSEGDYLIAQNTRKATQDETSFGLVRTNPKLTGNVKITVDSDNQIWLNSIDAEKELSDDRFKKFKLSKDSSYAVDLNRFFDKGNTPAEIVYSLYQSDTQYTSTKRTLDKQYDRFYQYGVTQLKSKFYDEDFAFFAPFYLKEEIPDYFVIFRTEGPLNQFSYEMDSSQWASQVSSEILANSRIVKTFSLAKGTAVGDYLRNIVRHPSRRESDLTVSYQTNGYTTFNGIAYTKGSFADMGELLYDYFNQENPLSVVEDFITLGFQRNKIISSHVINLEFLFDDDTAEEYTINRYFGLYVNAVDLARFTMSQAGLQQYSLSVNQLPLPRKNVDGNPVSLKSFTQTNDTGIRIYADASTIERIPSLTREDFTSLTTAVAAGSTVSSVTFAGDLSRRMSAGDSILFSAESLTASAEILTVSYTDEETTVTFDNTSLVSDLTVSEFQNIQIWKADFYTETKLEAFRDLIFDNEYIEGDPKMFFVLDNDGDLHSVKKTRELYAHVDDFTDEKVIEITLKDNTIDISDFGGFTEILTQTPCEVLDTRGRSSLMVEIDRVFNPNDWLEVSWSPGPTNQGYPLRWRVIANSTGLAAGDSWPSYGIQSDSEGEYYFTYFHPGDSSVELEDVVKSVSDAFRRFPYLNFEVVSDSTKLYFRSTQDGRVSDTATLSFFTDNLRLKVMGIEAPESGSIPFIGGSDRKRTRAKISADVAKGMLIDEYVSTQGSFSALRQYDIFGNTIIFSPYLEEPVYDEEGESLLSYTGVNDYLVVSVEDEDKEIQKTSDSKLTTYELYRPFFGILSVMPLRDFDTDFYYSDYTRSYTPELVEYFGRAQEPGKVISVTGNVYEFDRGYTFSSYPVYVPYMEISENGIPAPILHYSDSQLLFEVEGGATAVMVSPVGGTFPGEGAVLLPMPDDKALYVTDLELSKFKGFASLSAVISAEDEEEFGRLENLWDPTRFTVQLLGSEYERLSENYLKTLCRNSRVVPYIMKWVSPQGKDIRDNPYRFNYHRSFGNMSFSPSTDISADPRYHTHEWPYIDSIPDKYLTSVYPENLFSYFFDHIDSKYDFSSVRKDWFSEYFSVGYPVERIVGEDDPVKVIPSERYSYFNFEDFSDKTYTLFRGHRIEINDLDSEGNIVRESTRFDDYRFSVVVRTEEESPFDTKDPVEFRMTVNYRWKFIVLVITVRINSYRIPRGKMRYVDMYTLLNSQDVSVYEYDPLYATAGLDSFSKAIASDKKLSDQLNLQNYSQDNTLLSSYQYYDGYGFQADYGSDYTEEIVPLSSGDFSGLVAFFSLSNLEITASVDAPSLIYARKTLKLSGNNLWLKFSSVPVAVNVLAPYGIINWEDYIFFHQSGGENALEGVRERLSFQEIARVMEGKSTKSEMIYEIYDKQGNKSETPDFSFRMVSPEALTRIYDYYPVNDPDKPAAFYTQEEIGAVLESQKDLQTIYRYQGNFSPKFRDVLTFWLREDASFTDISTQDFLLANTHMGEELPGFSILKNQFLNKVADNEVLSIQEGSGYLPVYPLVGEIAIDKKDIFAWSSSWDKAYYRKYSSVTDFTEVDGTSEMREVKSLLGSKVMKVPSQFDLYEFIPVESSVPTLSKLDEISYYVTDTNITMRMNVYDRLIREMMSDDRAFREFVNRADLFSDYASSAREYVIRNIMELYRIGEVKFYVLQTGNPSSDSIATVANDPERPIIETVLGYTLSETELRERGYVWKRDVNVSSSTDLTLSLTFPLDSRFYTSVSVGVTVVRI